MAQGGMPKADGVEVTLNAVAGELSGKGNG
jgi:hypothetical protein